MSETIYKPIPGYEGMYSVSNKGDVYSHYTNRVLSPKLSNKGYLRVTLCKGKGNHKTIVVHRLVAEVFIPNQENKPTVNHINEDKTDNSVENLEWATIAEQNLHGTRTERARLHTDYTKRSEKIDYKAIASKHDYSRQDMCNREKTAVYKDGELLGIFASQHDASEFSGVSKSKVSMCVNGKKKSCKGYEFKRLPEEE